jgi:hypothetical protein
VNENNIFIVNSLGVLAGAIFFSLFCLLSDPLMGGISLMFVYFFILNFGNEFVKMLTPRRKRFGKTIWGGYSLMLVGCWILSFLLLFTLYNIVTCIYHRNTLSFSIFYYVFFVIFFLFAIGIGYVLNKKDIEKVGELVFRKYKYKDIKKDSDFRYEASRILLIIKETPYHDYEKHLDNCEKDLDEQDEITFFTCLVYAIWFYPNYANNRGVRGFFDVIRLHQTNVTLASINFILLLISFTINEIL